MKAPLPNNESERLEALYRYQILNTTPEEAFDGITRLAAQVCETPISLISLIDKDRQWFKSRVGLEAEETSRDVSFCAHAILNLYDICVIPDATADERFAENPLVTSDPDIRFYAGVPLVTSDGHALGTLCVIDRTPRELKPEQENALRILANQVTLQLQLRLNIAELARAVGERKRAEEERWKSEERYRILYEDNPTMYFTLDAEGKVLSVNTFGAEQLGYVPEELVGGSVLSVSYEDDKGAVLERMNLCLENPGRVFSWELHKVRKDGSVIWVKEAARAIRDAGGRAVVLVVCEDITGRKRLEEALRRARDELEVRVVTRTAELSKSNELLKHEIAERERVEDELKILNNITQAMNESFELEEVYRIALDKVIEQEYVDIAGIYLVDEARNEAVLQNYRNIPDGFLRRAGRVPYPKGATWKVINTGEILNVSDAQNDPDVGPAGRELGFRSMLGIPIALEGKVIGVLWLLSYKEHRFTKTEEDLLTSIGRQITIAVARANLYRELSKKNRYETIIRTVTQSVHQSIDLQEVLENAVEVLKQNIKEEINFVAIYLTEDDKAVLKAHRGLNDRYIERAGKISYPKGFTWKTIIDGKPMYCPDVDLDTVIGPAGRETGTKSYVSMPIRSEGRTVGTININSFKKNAFDEDELRLLEIVAQQIEMAINNAKQAETLAQSEERYRTLFDQSPVGVYIFDTNLIITQCNERFAQILQSSRDEIVGVDLKKLRNQCVQPLIKKLFEGKPGAYEGFYEATNSSAKLWISVRLSPLFDAGGKVVGGMAVVEDITGRKRAEEELIKTQKLESLGVLAGGIAHEFNNILTAVLGNVSLAKTFIHHDHRAYKRLNEAEKASLRASHLTQQLLTFSKGGTPVRKVASIGELITESASFAVRGSNVRCEFDITEDLWSVEVDEGQIGHVIGNLVINAKEAMPQGGVINVAAENVTVSEEDELPIERGRYVKIRVEDEGVGISEENLSKIFDPYFTTKRGNSGLGLAAVYSIAKKHGGYVGVKSEVDAGARFYVYLPASGEAGAETNEPGEEKLVSCKGKVLVMDDDEMIRELTEEMLRQIGYEVELASEGGEAVGLYREAKKSNSPFDAVILDLTVPGGTGGKEAIKLLLEIDPDVKAIVSSGYFNDPVISQYKNYGFKEVATKPYKLEDLREKLNRLIKGVSPIEVRVKRR